MTWELILFGLGVVLGWILNDVWSKWYYDRLYNRRHPK